MKNIRTIFRFTAIFALAAFAACGEPPVTPLRPAPAASRALSGGLQVVGRSVALASTVTSARIGPGGGTLYLSGGHSLHFPPGALQAPTTITAVSDRYFVRVDFGPEGLIFPYYERPTLTYSYQGLGPQVNPWDLSIVYVENGQASEVLPTTVDPLAQVVRARIDHFSTYALATD